MDLRKFLKTQTVFLDLQANNLAEIMEVLLENMVNNNMVSYDKCADIMNAVLQDHTHQFEGLKKVSWKYIWIKLMISSAISQRAQSLWVAKKRA